jgi:predicted deacylase
MAGLTNYSPKVDLDYAQYHQALLDSVVNRDRITALSKEIGRHGEVVPDATRVDYNAISSLLRNVEKLMYLPQTSGLKKSTSASIVFLLRVRVGLHSWKLQPTSRMLKNWKTT